MIIFLLISAMQIGDLCYSFGIVLKNFCCIINIYTIAVKIMEIIKKTLGDSL